MNKDRGDDDEEIDDMKIPVVFNEARHRKELEVYNVVSQTWRMKERMKTVSVALVLCLNVGVDPPDIVKTQPCARLECWIDPLTMSPQRALEAIGNTLQKQYERWQPRARYKHSLDPTVDEIKKLCTSLRRNAKEERVLFHYNGHGVPKPTPNGEIWVFNKSYTQYIPLSVYDLQAWMGAPSIYVYDCSNAGIIVDTFKQYADQHEQELEKLMTQNKQFTAPTVFQSYKNCIQLAACSSNQILPMNPELPADLFTSCLTTPIKIALRCFILQKNSMLIGTITKELLEKIPGQVNDRRTMLGELNWIFTAITDTIAWNVLPRDLFQKLFRQDLLVASLFRNFLLAERIMRLYDCTPVSSPKLPPTYQHPMWNAWDLALDICLSQLQYILDLQVPFEHSSFFAEQLTGFQVWLDFGNEHRNPPEQLPIVLQVLLSQVHRLRALDLLGRFLDLGPWAVNLALSVGIFPYVLKLLQSPARELRPLLVFIWAKILAVDDTCQADLVRDGGYNYFLTVLGDPLMPAEHRTMAAYILSCIVSKYRPGQVATLKGNLISICLEQLNDPCPQLRKWLAICLGQTWARYEAARWCGVRDSAHEKLYTLLADEVPEVRAAAIYALGAFINSHADRSDHANTIDHSIGVTLVSNFNVDASPLVRKELVVALQWLFLIFENTFVSIASKCSEDEDQAINAVPFTKDNQFLSPAGSLKRVGSANRLKNFGISLTSHNVSDSEALAGGILASSQNVDRLKRVCSTSSICSLGGSSLPASSHIHYSSTFLKLWQAIRTLEKDPMPYVAEAAGALLQYLFSKVTLGSDASVLHDNNNQPSVSAPSSPMNKSTFLASDSPPTSGFSQEAVRSSTPVRSRIRKTSDRTMMKINDESVSWCSKSAVVHSQFLEWSSSYFEQPVMAAKDALDPEGSVFKGRLVKFSRNKRIRLKAYKEYKRVSSDKLEDQVFINKNPNIPAVIKFHPYESYLVVADKDHLSLWDWELGGKLTYFCNQNSKSSRITAVDFINPHDVSLLLIGTDEGAVRVWKDITDDAPYIVTAWNVLHEMVPSTRGSGLILNWSQQNKQLLASGDVRLVRLWDAEQELKIADYPTGADCCVTALSRGLKDESILIAGCGDGSVRVFDLRLSPSESRVMTWREHQGWVVDVQFHGSLTGGGEIISGSVNGDVKIWDTRKGTPVRSFLTSQGMTAMAVHPSVDLFACGSVNQFIQTYNTNGKNLSFIRYHDGFMGQRIGPVSCLTFHPYCINLAAGSTDSFISVYSLEKKR